jgi:hypothetical protein
MWAVLQEIHSPTIPRFESGLFRSAICLLRIVVIFCLLHSENLRLPWGERKPVFFLAVSTRYFSKKSIIVDKY